MIYSQPLIVEIYTDVAAAVVVLADAVLLL